MRGLFKNRRMLAVIVCLAGALVGSAVYAGYFYSRRAEASRYAHLLIADLDAQIHELEAGHAHVHGPGCSHGPTPADGELDPHRPFLERYARYAPPEDLDSVLIRLDKLKDLLDKKQEGLSTGR